MESYKWIYSSDTLELSSHLQKYLPAQKKVEYLLNIRGEVFRKIKHRRTVKFTIEGKDYFIKIHHPCGWWEILKELLQGRRPVVSARNEYQAIKCLSELNILTMKIAGYGRLGWNPACRKSFIITDALEGMVNLESLTNNWGGLKGKKQIELKRLLIQKLASISRSIHSNGLNHRDYYLCHFMVKQRDWTQWQMEDGIDIYLIDLHRMQMRKKVPIRWIIKDLSGLLFSALGCNLTERDLFRFIFHYQKNGWNKHVQHRQFWQKVISKALKLYASMDK